MKAKITLFTVCCLAFVSKSQAQADKESVMKPVRLLFEAMKKGDSALLKNVFAKQVTIAVVGTSKEGKPTIRYESSINGFAKAVGTPHPDAWSEMIWNEKIEIDGNLAQFWANFAFYLGKRFSHCGVDAFQLVKEEDGEWRIFHMADTRQKEGCNVPKIISDQFK